MKTWLFSRCYHSLPRPCEEGVAHRGSPLPVRQHYPAKPWTYSTGRTTRPFECGFPGNSRSPVTSSAPGSWSNSAHRWSSFGSGAVPVSFGTHHNALAVSSVNNRSTSDSPKPCNAVSLGRSKTARYSAKSLGDNRNNTRPTCHQEHEISRDSLITKKY